MKAGHKTRHIPTLLPLDGKNDCIIVYNFHHINIVWHCLSKLNTVKKDSDIVGVWIPKGTKRPDNWPNKK